MAFLNQLWLMLWKNWKLQSRKMVVSIFEILLPLAFAFLLLYIRSIIKPKPVTTMTTFPRKFIIPAYFDTYIGYSPNHTEVNKLMTLMEETSYTNVTFKGFHDESAMIDYVRSHPDEIELCVVFRGTTDDSSSLPDKLDFVVRPYGDDYFWFTDKMFPDRQYGRPADDFTLYEEYDVLPFQLNVAMALMTYRLLERGENPGSMDSAAVFSQRFAFPSYLNDPMIIVVQKTLPLFLILSFILCVIINTKNLVYEKERKLKESMKLMGLKASVHLWSWFITFSIYLVPVLLLYAVFIGADLTEQGPILRKSSTSLFFVFLMCYGFSLITFCFMTSSFVQKANIGAAAAGILFFGFYSPFFYLGEHYARLSKSAKLGSSLLMNCAMSLGAHVIGLYEGIGDGLQWNNFHKPATIDDNLSLLECMAMLLLDGFIHLFVYWYLDNVRPGEFGVAKPFYFCFTKSYWFGSKTTTEGNYQSYPQKIEETDSFEQEPTNLKKGIEIKNLRKIYGKKSVVQGISMNMFEGQISVLLGHNGAGKTTTMSMLTGFIAPSSGTAIVNDYDITTNIVGVRRSLGLCPQHNILFDTLTVEEHLQFFARLKGASINESKDEIWQLVDELGLGSKFKCRSSGLSGGQKRKLSVAIALVAGSKVIMLDEPSSGMDPAARRQTWDVLQKHKEGRTMVLTTQYMDEADVLGDRIAIMSEGVIKCNGTSMYLKKLYGAGYHLIVVKKPDCDVNKLTQVVTSHISNAALEQIINQEVTYLLPDKETSKFSQLFKDLEEKKAELGLSSFGTSATTMEEVFLKVGDDAPDDDDKLDKQDIKAGNISSNNDDEEKGQNSMQLQVAVSGNFNISYTSNTKVKQDKQVKQVKQSPVDARTTVGYNTPTFGGDIMDFNKGFTKRSGLSLAFAKIHALFVKKALHTWRNRFISLVQLLLPVLFATLGMVIEESKPTAINDPSLALDLSKFRYGTEIPISVGPNETENDMKIRKLYIDMFSNTNHVSDCFIAKEYGGYDNYIVQKTNKMGIGNFNKKVMIGLEINGEVITAFYNGQSFHMQPISLNYALNALLRSKLKSTTYSMQASVHPLPTSAKTTEVIEMKRGMTSGFNIGLFISFGMAFLTTLFIHYLIKERQVGSKHLQVVSGVTPLSFWIPTFLWDFINYLIPSLLLIVVFFCFSKTPYTGEERPLIVVIVLVMFGWAVLPFMYVIQFVFKEPPTGVVTIIMVNIVSGLVCLVTIFILNIPGLDAKDKATTFDSVFKILFPNYNMAQSFVSIYTNYNNIKQCKTIECSEGKQHGCCKGTCGGKDEPICIPNETNYLALDKPGVGGYMLALAVQGFVYFILVFLVEYNVLQKLFYAVPTGSYLGFNKNKENKEEDSDVAAERKRINSSTVASLNKTDSLLLVNLFKRYGQFVAVDHVCIGIPQQECFGLLGQNGAGKTSTFKMLTGEVMVTGGNAYLNGYDIRNNIKQVQSSLGYCPQFDALIDQMTGRETLTMYARLRGVPEANIEFVVNSLIEILMLQPHADKLAGAYSGGNKRKLSTAISLVGDPMFIMLDEPSAGMDPKARRQMWNVLSAVRASGRTLILTSHSMEECDALCTRIVIMVNGHFVCLGSPQHLKNKFGQGYTLTVKLTVTGKPEDASNTEEVVNFICEQLPGTKVFDDHQGYVHFQVPDATVKLADVFDLMESTKVNYNVEDYSVHQTTLEQIFLTFTRKQFIPKETKSQSFVMKICCPCIKPK